jgi:CDP-4-dehydro-6-deoxyglucose reductase
VPTVTVHPGGTSVSVESGLTILEGLFGAGYAYRIGCRRGGCGICKVDLVEGEVEYNRTVAETVLSETERRHRVCLSCRAVPRGNVTIALRQEELRRTNPFLALLHRAG